MSDNFLKVEGESNLLRDKTSNAIINSNINALYEAKKRKEERLESRKDIESLKKDMSDLKSILQTILSKLDK